MAKLWIREYVDVGVAGAGRALPIPAEPGTDQTPKTSFSSSAQSAAFAASTKYIGVVSDTAFHYVVGADPTATTSAIYVPAFETRWVSVRPTHKIAVIAAA